jgi:alpha-ribazole phosphatase
MIVYLLRHGAPKGGRKYRGNSINDPLSLQGWKTMFGSIKGLQFDYVYTSPMKRCLSFSKCVTKKARIVSNFKEIGFGDWEGKSPMEIGLEKIKLFKKNPSRHQIPKAENIHEFKIRVLKEYKKILKRHKKNEAVLIVTHAGVIRIILGYENMIDINDLYRLEIKNAQLISLKPR